MNKKTEIVNADAKTLKELVDGSALTIEGLAEPSIGDFLDWIEGLTKLKARRAYVTKGLLANREWGLTGDNAYQDGLNIVSVKLDDMEDWNKVVAPRFQIGARWADDIYENNVRRERDKAKTA
jgi:hypothetical protein